MVFADDGTIQQGPSKEMLLRVAAAWSRQPAGAARIEEVKKVDQWTVSAALRTLRPLWKYLFPDGQQVYVSGASAEVVQYTTTRSRLGAWLGAIPHWLYFRNRYYRGSARVNRRGLDVLTFREVPL